MKLLTMVGLCVLTAVLGGGTVWVIDQGYWDAELKRQLAEKDKLVDGLNADVSQLRTDLGALKGLNDEMRQSLEVSFSKTVDIVRSNQSALDKLRRLVTGLDEIQKSVAAWEARQ